MNRCLFRPRQMVGAGVLLFLTLAPISMRPEESAEPFEEIESLAGYRALTAYYAELVEGLNLSCGPTVADLALEAHSTEDLARVRRLETLAQAETLRCLSSGERRQGVLDDDPTGAEKKIRL